MSTQTKKLFRSSDNKMIGGVCAGLGEYFDIDPTLVRIGFVVLSLIGWVGAFVLAYLIMWIIIPDEPASVSELS